jgi:hypothetical protein
MAHVYHFVSSTLYSKCLRILFDMSGDTFIVCPVWRCDISFHQFVIVCDADFIFQALEDGDYEVVQHEGEAPPVVGHLSIMPIRAPIFVNRGPDSFEAKVLFDNYSHQTHHLRAYVQCRHHPKCFKYTQVRFFSSEETCASWLYLWLANGKPNEEQSKSEHMHAEPTVAQAAEAVRDLTITRR